MPEVTRELRELGGAEPLLTRDRQQPVPVEEAEQPPDVAALQRPHVRDAADPHAEPTLLLPQVDHDSPRRGLDVVREHLVQPRLVRRPGRQMDAMGCIDCSRW